MSETFRVEATGETVGEAKWNALRQLRALASTLDEDAVTFQVISEGKRGLLGVGYEPAQVAAMAVAEPAAHVPPARTLESADPTVRLEALMAQIAVALSVNCRIEVREAEGTITGTFTGDPDDLGLVIGRHGQTLDAIQLLAGAILRRGREDRTEVIVDAAGYRDRRRRRLEELAAESAREARRGGARVALEPMPAAERKIIHTFLESDKSVVTSSEGADPDRHVVVDPA